METENMRLRQRLRLVDCCEAAIRSSDSLEVPEFSVPFAATGTCEACPPLTASAWRRAGIRPGRGDVAEAVTATVAHSGTPPLAKGAFTAEKRPQAEKGPLLAGSQPQV